jgi:DNA-binding MarR family transcriptional regulator
MPNKSIAIVLRAGAEKLTDIFTQLQRDFVLYLSKELTRGQVSFAQYLLLSILEQLDAPLTMTLVAGRMKHTTAAATGLVDRLEKLGYVRRQSTKEDRRKVLVQITNKGTELVKFVREDMIRSVTHLMEQLTTEEQNSWVNIYEKILPFCKDK